MNECTYLPGAAATAPGIPIPRAIRLDLSELAATVRLAPDTGDEPSCGWCAEPCRRDYVVLVESQCYLLCPLCWGRSPGYLTLREWGVAHEDALHRIGSVPTPTLNQRFISP